MQKCYKCGKRLDTIDLDICLACFFKGNEADFLWTELQQLKKEISHLLDRTALLMDEYKTKLIKYNDLKGKIVQLDGRI